MSEANYKLWPSPFGDNFLREMRRVKEDLFIVAPYIRSDAVDRVVEALRSNPKLHDLNIRVLTRFDIGAFEGRHSHPEALQTLLDLGQEGGPTVEIRWHLRLHAKVYIFDGESLLVTSANLTDDSLFSEPEAGDLEYGVLLKSRESAQAGLRDAERWWRQAKRVSSVGLQRLIDRGG